MLVDNVPGLLEEIFVLLRLVARYKGIGEGLVAEPTAEESEQDERKDHHKLPETEDGAWLRIITPVRRIPVAICISPGRRSVRVQVCG